MAPGGGAADTRGYYDARCGSRHRLAQTDATGVAEYTVDGKVLQKMVTDGVIGAPGYPSGRVLLRIYPGSSTPIDLRISLALHPSVRL